VLWTPARSLVPQPSQEDTEVPGRLAFLLNDTRAGGNLNVGPKPWRWDLLFVPRKRVPGASFGTIFTKRGCLSSTEGSSLYRRHLQHLHYVVSTRKGLSKVFEGFVVDDVCCFRDRRAVCVLDIYPNNGSVTHSILRDTSIVLRHARGEYHLCVCVCAVDVCVAKTRRECVQRCPRGCDSQPASQCSGVEQVTPFMATVSVLTLRALSMWDHSFQSGGTLPIGGREQCQSRMS
jgi:hypothetical protein